MTDAVTAGRGQSLGAGSGAKYDRLLNRGRSDTLPTVYRNLAYTTLGGRLQRLDIYLPSGAPPAGGWPVVLAIHGGGWRRLDKREYGQRIASGFLPSSYAVVSVNYVLSAANRSSWPINLKDVQAAVRWVKLRAANYDIDPGRIVAMGESAGANLANLLGTTSVGAAAVNGVTSAVNAVVSFSSPTDLTTLFAESPGAAMAVRQFLGGDPSMVPASYLEASPVEQVHPGDPPVFLVHGADDTLVPDAQSFEMAVALAEAHVRHDFVVIPGAPHALDFPKSTSSILMSQILAFLNETWKDKGSIP